VVVSASQSDEQAVRGVVDALMVFFLSDGRRTSKLRHAVQSAACRGP
jgi:hypothetical protein